MSIVKFGDDRSEVHIYTDGEDWFCHAVDCETPFKARDPHAIMNYLEECERRNIIIPDWVYDVMPLGDVGVAIGDSGPAAIRHTKLADFDMPSDEGVSNIDGLLQLYKEFQ